MVLVRRKGYDIPSTIPEPLLPTKSSVTSSIPPLLPQSFQPSTTTTAYDDTMTTSHLPTLPALQQQLKSQTLPVGMKSVTSKFPTQLPLLPPPSRKQLTRSSNPATGIDSSMTTKFNGSDEQQVDSPTKTIGLSHSNWPSALTSDSGKPLKFYSNTESTVPLPQTPNDAPFCPITDSSMEKSHLVNVAGGSNKHKISGPSLTKPEAQTADLSVNEAPVKSKSKKNVLSIPKNESGDEDIFDSGEDDETSALYAVVKPRGAKGKSSESKTLKHSTIRSSNSFKRHKPKPPPKPEPYSVSKYKKKSSSPSPGPGDTAEGDVTTVDVQGQVSTTANNMVAIDKVDSNKESSVTVDDPGALYAKVIKKKPSMDLMEPIQLSQDILSPEQPVEKNIVSSIAVEKEEDAEVIGATNSATDITAASVDVCTSSADNTDGRFGHTPVQLVSMIRVESDSKAITTTTTAAASNDDKPVPMPRKKHHRSSSLDLNKMFQKRKSAEHLGTYKIMFRVLQ